MSNIPKLKLELRVHNRLLEASVQTQCIDTLVDQVRSSLGSHLPKHCRDIQLIVDLARALEKCPSKIDKKPALITVLRLLFPGQVAFDEASILDLETTIDQLHSLGLFEKRGVFGRAYKYLFGGFSASQKKA